MTDIRITIQNYLLLRRDADNLERVRRVHRDLLRATQDCGCTTTAAVLRDWHREFGKAIGEDNQ